MPAFDHVVVIVMENKPQSAVLGSPNAPAFNAYASRYATLTRYGGVAHPSLPNYLALVSGSTQGIRSDCTSCVVSARNLADTLARAHLTWKAYAEGLPRPGFTGASSGRYVKRHVPFLYFRSVVLSPSRRKRVVPLRQLSRDLAADRLPSFALVIPDLCHDMHDCPVATGDAWLKRFLPPLLKSRTPGEQRDLRRLRRDERLAAGDRPDPCDRARPARRPGLEVRRPHVPLRAAAHDRGRLGPAAARPLGEGRADHRNLALTDSFTVKRPRRQSRHGLSGRRRKRTPWRDLRVRVESSRPVTMLPMLSRAIEARDPYTQGHSTRVTVLAEAIARRLGWDEERLSHLQVGGPLHDLGKLAISDDVLSKPGRLDEHELAQIREHPKLGARILFRLSSFRKALPYVLYHHERWDGGGYPTGRSGEQIPLEARVLAIADAFDAMTSDRPYRRALSHEEAVAEVARCAGTQFDPEIVAVFLEVVGEAAPLTTAAAS